MNTIFLHGALGSAAQFDTLFRLLPTSANNKALNLPGHGGLPINASYSLPLFSEALLHEIKITSRNPVRLFGYSMGGYVALYFARKYPDLVSEVVLLNSKLEWSPEIAARMQGMMNPEKIEAKAPLMAENLAAAHAPEDWKTVARQTSALLHDFGQGRGLPETAFGQIACPVRILRGENDAVVGAAECLHVLSLLKQGTYQEIRDSGHLMEQVNLMELIQIFDLGTDA